MKTAMKDVTVRDLVAGYRDDGEGGVVGYGGNLDIRPPFQREFIYNDKERAAVISTVSSGYPLGLMCWSERDDGTYEIIDGQQRTISIAQYVAGNFSHNDRFFHNLTSDESKQFMDYELLIYACNGTDSEKLVWFETINIAGKTLTAQELRNAVYAGPWLADAKRYFSRNGCPAYGIGKDYINGTAIRQEFLETAIRWASKEPIGEYMGRHQQDENASELWADFQARIDWVKRTFPEYRPSMKGADWGGLYDGYATSTLNPTQLEKNIAKLHADEDVTNQRGIYDYVLTGKERSLNIRAFAAQVKSRVYERQGRKCARCQTLVPLKETEADHIKPWAKGGKTVEDNCQVLCKDCHKAVS